MELQAQIRRSHTSSYSFFCTLGALRGFFGMADNEMSDRRRKRGTSSRRCRRLVDTRRQAMERTESVRLRRVGVGRIYARVCPKDVRVVSNPYPARQTCFVTNSERGRSVFFFRERGRSVCSTVLGLTLNCLVSLGPHFRT
jgi:hypothetical protein